jgi:hypothetical protein
MQFSGELAVEAPRNKVFDRLRDARSFAGIFGIWLCPSKCVADGLRVLRGEQHPHDLAAVIVMLKNFLTNELTLAITVGSEPNPFGCAQCLANGSELGGFVAALCRASAIKTLIRMGQQNMEMPPEMRDKRAN